MERIKISGVWLSEEQEVRTGIVDAFQLLLTEDSEWKADIEGLNLNQISQQEADILELPFMEEEVHSTQMDINGDKAPGSDGFTGAFWQFCWEFVKRRFWRCSRNSMSKMFFSRASIPRFWFLSQKNEGRRSWGTSGLSVSWAGCINFWPRCWPIGLKT